MMKINNPYRKTIIEDYEREAFPRALSFKERLQANFIDILGGVVLGLLAVVLISGLWVILP
ncbi:hypothetical protein OAF54_03215 [bacterium]|nr:hypothetical protein [bacterium]